MKFKDLKIGDRFRPTAGIEYEMYQVVLEKECASGCKVVVHSASPEYIGRSHYMGELIGVKLIEDRDGHS